MYVELLDRFDRWDIQSGAVDADSLESEAGVGLGGECPGDCSRAGFGGVALTGGVFADPVAGFARGCVCSHIVDPGAAEKAVGLFTEYSGANIGECGRVGESEHLLADVFGGGFEGAVVVLGPGHPGEEVIVAAFVDGVEDFLGVLEPVGADDEALGFELAVEGAGGGPGEAWGWKVVL